MTIPASCNVAGNRRFMLGPGKGSGRWGGVGRPDIPDKNNDRILIFCYTRIFQEIRKLSRRLRAHSSAEDQDIIAQEKGVAVTMLIVLATFVIMALPYLAYANYTTMRRDKKHFSGYLNPVAYTFLYMSSMCNPIIYAFRSAAFREGYKEILCQKANYVTDAEANNTQRTNRLMSVISILRRGSLPANQNIVHKNGDIVITRGDRIVCVRKASAGVRSPGNGINTIPENLNEINEDAEEDTGNAEALCNNETFRLLKANIERESLADATPYDRPSSLHNRVNGNKSKNNSAKERSGTRSPSVETPLLTQEHHELNDEVCSTSTRGALSEPISNERFDLTRRGEKDNHSKANKKMLEKQKGEIYTNKKTENRPSSCGFFTNINKQSVSKSRDFLDTTNGRQDQASKANRRLSKSSEDLQRPTTFVRLPSMEFLDPPVQIFRPRSNTSSLEKLAMLKAKFKGHLSDRTHTSTPRPKSDLFENASDFV
ncbi:hypothetical protein Btru_027577 [Bulinus truncatus]|nr:hypothetical protein Btru_027577 [Bulinus truncatus]